MRRSKELKGCFNWLVRACALIVLFVLGALVVGRYQVSRWEREATVFRELGGRVFASGDGASKLLGPRGIYRISLRNTHTTDADLARIRPHIERMPNLLVLDLSYTDVTEAGLQNLKRMGHLNTLGLHQHGTRISETSIQDLRGTLPETRVLWGRNEKEAYRQCTDCDMLLGGLIKGGLEEPFLMFRGHTFERCEHKWDTISRDEFRRRASDKYHFDWDREMSPFWSDP